MPSPKVKEVARRFQITPIIVVIEQEEPRGWARQVLFGQRRGAVQSVPYFLN